MSVVAGRLWSAMLMTSLAMTSSGGRDVTDGEIKELKIAVIVPYDERRMFSRYKVLPAVRDALQAHDVTERLVPGYRFIVIEADSGCNSGTAPMAAIDLHYEQKVFLIFVCPMQYIA